MEKDQILTDSKEYCNRCICVILSHRAYIGSSGCTLFDVELKEDNGKILRHNKCKKLYPNGIKIAGL